MDVSLPLWSARALAETPAEVQRIHEAYLRAGAGAVTTNTFRTHARSLAKAGWEDRAETLTATAVDLARRARARVAPDALVLGSVAPLEDCYQPRLAPPEGLCETEHGRLMRHLSDAGVDLLLIETIGTLREARGAVRAARRIAPDRWMISFCLRSSPPEGALLSGEPLTGLLEELADARAVGVNCIAAPQMTRQIVHLAAHAPRGPRLIAYANVGYADPARGWVNTDAVDPPRYAEYARQWIEAGATVVGGCCGTTPETISAVARTLGPASTRTGLTAESTESEEDPR